MGQEDEYEEITLQPEIWLYDAVYQDVDHCMKWPHSANVCIFWSRLLFSEHLVYIFQHIFLQQKYHSQFVTVTVTFNAKK